MFKRFGIAAAVLGIAATALLALAPSSSASASAPDGTLAAADTAASFDYDDWPLKIQGRPLRLDSPGANGWFFWHDGNGLHIRTTTPAPKDHVFTAILATNGTFSDVSKVRLEGADDIALLKDGHVLVVKFHTYNGVDGADFRIAGGDAVRLRFDEAGKLVPPSHIFMGQYGVHPAENPFAMRRG